MEILLGPALNLLPMLVLGGVFVAGTLRYAQARGVLRTGTLSIIDYPWLSRIAIGFRVLYAGLLTVGQYYVWDQASFTRTFLNAPVTALPIPFIRDLPWLFGTKLGYFILSSVVHFWLNVALSLGVAWLFFLFLAALKRHRERFFEVGEIELGYLCALVVGWPNVALFVFLTFAAVVAISIVRGIAMGQRYTTLGWPFIAAAIVTVFFGSALTDLLNLGVLRI